MIQLGIINRLKINRSMPQGFYLISEDDNEEVLLPNKYIARDMEIGQEIDVFVYTDSEDRVVATTATPTIKLGEFANLEVKSVSSFGAFLDWGLDKDLLVPLSNQAVPMKAGQSYIVYLYEDENTDRLVATSRYLKYMRTLVTGIEVGQEVDLLVEYQTDLGVKVIVNNKYMGLVFHNHVFKRLEPGMRTTGYVKTIRPDGKLDISLEPLGHLSIEPNAQKIVDYLKINKGVLPLSDNSDPELIKRYLQMSKKTFKKALGTLYKQRIVEIHPEKVVLIDSPKKS